jgi:hypothetical protein
MVNKIEEKINAAYKFLELNQSLNTFVFDFDSIIFIANRINFIVINKKKRLFKKPIYHIAINYSIYGTNRVCTGNTDNCDAVDSLYS